MKDNDAIQFLGDMKTTLTSTRIAMLVSVVLAAVVSLGSLWLYHKHTDEIASDIYIVDQGSVLQASRTSNEAQRDLEVVDHITRFHELFYNIAPNVNTINQNVNRALELADESAYNYYSDLKESRYFTQLININATQQISVDSVHVNVNTYPYQVESFNTLYILRNSNISKYSLKTTCEVTETSRTHTNPHGLMIGKFFAEKAVLIETRERN